MLTLLKNLMRGNATEVATPGRELPRMSLDERKAYRREMLYQSVRESLMQLEALACMYRFTVAPADRRHHRFIVRVDVTPLFQAHQSGKLLGFAEIEAVIKRRSLERHGVLVEGMIWRVDESCTSFTRSRRTEDQAQARLQPQTPVQRLLRPRLSRWPYTPVSAGEQEQFTRAIQQGLRPAPIQVGAQAYASDLMPIEAAPEGDDTQPSPL